MEIAFLHQVYLILQSASTTDHPNSDPSLDTMSILQMIFCITDILPKIVHLIVDSPTASMPNDCSPKTLFQYLLSNLLNDLLITTP